MVTALAIIGTVGTVLSAGAAVQQSQQQKKAARGAEQAQRRQRRRTSTLIAEQEADEKRIRARDIQRRQVRRRAAGRQRTRATILTGPTGVPGTQRQTTKTLLGA